MAENLSKKIEQKVIRFIARNKLIEKNDKILVAFSGGVDSSFVLFLLKKYQKKFQIKLAAAHVNHLLRGKEAERDELHCAETAKKLGVEFYSEKVDVKNFARKKKLSTEEAARILRYEALEKFAEKCGANKIATAHNLNDNAETVLLNLLKGAGTKAVAGIPVKRGKIIRPALIVPRNEIEQWNSANKVSFINDSTNSENVYLRNKLRNLIFPLIEEHINPKAAEAIYNFTAILNAQNEAIRELVKERAEKLFTEKSGLVEFETDKLTSLDLKIFGDILHFALRKYFNVNADFDDAEKIRRLAENQKGKKIDVKGNLTAIKESGKIVFARKQKPRKFFAEFTSEAETETPHGRISVLKTKRKKRRPGCELISADNLSEKFILRNWRAGDKFIPLGMKKSKKISDFLTDLKIPANKRKEILVLENNGKIIWVVGLRISDEVKITENTKRRMELCANTTN